MMGDEVRMRWEDLWSKNNGYERILLLSRIQSC